MLALAQKIQRSLKNEKKFKYMHVGDTHDLRDRQVLDIIVDNEFYSLLVNNEVGLIAESIWSGPPATSIFYTGVINTFMLLD